MRLSIVTINYNNAEGLCKTLASVATQSYRDIEHIIVDAASTDRSVEIIKDYADSSKHMVIWSSEKDNGIYNGMNKGICKASGEYIQILNSGDLLAAPDVTERMAAAMPDGADILYGNMVKYDYSSNKVIGKSGIVEFSLRNYFVSTMNHDCCYIRRDLFATYGLYDESLKIVSDWKWFLQVIGLGNVKPVYADIDVTIFDCSGISETNRELLQAEKRKVLQELLPPAVFADYDAHVFDIEQMNRLRKHHMYGLVYFIERVLFKLEKWGVLR